MKETSGNPGDHSLQQATYAGEYICGLLNGSSPNGAAPESFGPYANVIETLLLAYESGGTPRVRQAWKEAVRRNPELTGLISGEQPETEGWEIYSLADAYQPRPPLTYVVEGLFPLPSLSIVYGAPGTFKSLVLADLARCVAAGLPWLPPLARSPVAPKRTQQVPVVWCDFDNGIRRTHERVEALARGRDLPTTTPFAYVSMPSPWIDASRLDGLQPLVECIQKQRAQLVILDNLLTIKGRVDEHSAEMGNVMANLRRLTEDHGAAIIPIHHQRKDTGVKGRVGDRLRGHSSIEAALDLALLVEREPHTESLTLHSTKVRGVDVLPFGAQFTYDHKLGTTELATARFFGLAVKDTVTNRAIETAVMATVKADPRVNQTTLIQKVKSALPKVGVNRIRDVIERLVQEGRLQTASGERGAVLYTVP